MTPHVSVLHVALDGDQQVFVMEISRVNGGEGNLCVTL